MQEIIELNNQEWILHPRHLGRLKVYSQTLFKGMLAMMDNNFSHNNDEDKIDSLRNLDYWNSLELEGTMYDINIFLDGHSVKCEITKMDRVEIDDIRYKFSYESTDNQIVIWKCHLITKLYPNAVSGHNHDIISKKPKMYDLNYEYDFDSEFAIKDGDSYTNGLVRAVKKESRTPFTW